MLPKGKDPAALLALAIETLRNELMPALPAEKRYAAAMVANALEIAARDIAVQEEAAELALLDAVYEDGDGTMAQLAADIRRGTVDEKAQKDLRQRLAAHLAAELRVRNPRHLASRSAPGKGDG